MAKTDTAAEIKAANGVELDPEHYTQKQLDALKDKAADRAAFDALRGEYDAARPAQGGAGDGEQTPEQAKAEDSSKRKVKTGKKIDAGGTLLHPTDKVNIGTTPVAVTADEWVESKIRSGELAWA